MGMPVAGLMCVDGCTRALVGVSRYTCEPLASLIAGSTEPPPPVKCPVVEENDVFPIIRCPLAVGLLAELGDAPITPNAVTKPSAATPVTNRFRMLYLHDAPELLTNASLASTRTLRPTPTPVHTDAHRLMLLGAVKQGLLWEVCVELPCDVPLKPSNPFAFGLPF